METQKIHVALEGVSELIFDRFIDHNSANLPPEQKLYISRDQKLVLPSSNLIAFLFGEKPSGCVKECENPKIAKSFIRSGYASVFLNPTQIPILDKNKNEIVFTGFEKDNRFWILNEAPRTNGTKQPAKPRPVLEAPWYVNFEIELLKLTGNTAINENKLYGWFKEGGLRVGLGNYRPRFGRFNIIKWDIIDK